jgi:peptidoglycan/LPS O-acetylase OafA/YrhL
LTAVLDHIAYRQPGGRVYFDLPIAHFSAQALAGRHYLSVFLGNALFLQTILVPTFGSDVPLWSLANEFWYYMLFPALVLTAYSPDHLKRRFMGFLMAILVFVLLPGGMLAGFPIWLMGVAIYALPALSVGRGVRRGLHLVTSGLFFWTLMLSRVQRIPAGWSDPAVGLAFAQWLYCLVKIRTAPPAISPAVRVVGQTPCIFRWCC